MNGGEIIAHVLEKHGVPFLFTLCGGHISPILVGCKKRGIRVIDVRHEVTAVFAADAVARLSGIPGVAAVTAGPGLTNTITAVKNAQLAQSPVVVLGGATATALRGRGALQDIDQIALMKPHVKWCTSVKKVKDLAPALTKALRIAAEGVPGPVFVECPVDLLYDESVIREWYGLKSSAGRSFADRMVKRYLDFHVNRLFAGEVDLPQHSVSMPGVPMPDHGKVRKAAAALARAERPLLLIGSQALVDAANVSNLAAAVERLGLPVYLSGMARGLLGRAHPLQKRHKRRQALKEADLVILAGVPCDFRLDYGQHIRRSSYLISANRSPEDIRKNRRPNLAVPGDAGRFLMLLAEEMSGEKKYHSWHETLDEREQARETEIAEQAAREGELLNPLHVCRSIEQVADESALFVADGGDFVATASYILRPRAPLKWLDPGVFGTLGVGAGFALGAKLCNPDSEVWMIFGDGALAYSLAEFDTFVRHNIPVIAVVGNDATWMQIAREQVDMLGDAVGTELLRSDYHIAVEGLGGRGFKMTESKTIENVLDAGRLAAASGQPVLINAHLGKTDFRKGSISM